MKILQDNEVDPGEQISQRIGILSSCLYGVGGLLNSQSQEICINREEMSGIGDLMQEISKEMIKLKSIIEGQELAMSTKG